MEEIVELLTIFHMFLLLEELEEEVEMEEEEEEEIVQMMGLFLQFLELLEADGQRAPLMRVLFPNFHGRRNNQRQVWEELELRPPVFWYLTGFTPAELQNLVDQIELDVMQPRNVRGIYDDDALREPRSCGLTTRNRVLLVMVWMRQYMTIMALGEMFQIDKTTVSDEVHHILPILRVHLQNQVRWFTLAECDEMRGEWEHFPNAIGAVDATIHRVWKPMIGQGLFYRGDKRCHFFLTQLTTA